jgi:hypothetical protein
MRTPSPPFSPKLVNQYDVDWERSQPLFCLPSQKIALGMLTLRLYCASRALSGRKALKPPPKPLWRAIMLKLLRAGGVCTKRLLAGVPYTLEKSPA